MNDHATSSSAAQLFHLLSGFALTAGQSEAVIHLGEFLDKDDHDVFLLKGYAGTGKTFLIDALVKLLREQRRTALLSAPTGRAARIIREKTGEEATTIHGMIYDFDSIEERKTEGMEGSETYKLIVSLAVNEAPANAVFLTDEASLISDQYSEAEFFQCGSGYLLRDLMHFINFDNNRHHKKLILIGDDAQLPPVGMSFSPALSPDYLRSNFGVRLRSFEITDVVRQKAGSGILKNVLPLRQSLKAGVFHKLSFDTDLPDVRRIALAEAVSAYLESSNHRVGNQAVVVTRSNAEAGRFNRAIRERLFPGQPEAAQGDKLMVVKNTVIDGIRIANGDFALVRSIADDRVIRNITLRRKNDDTGSEEKVLVKLSFREAELALRLVDGSVATITTNIIENLLYEDRPQLSSDEHKALYVDFKQRHSDLWRDREAFSQALLHDRYFNALRVKFGYALTCHKAQGSEWDTAVVSCAAIGNPLSADNFRWLYTALTRSKARLYLLDPPKVEVGAGIKAAGLGPAVLASPQARLTISIPATPAQLPSPPDTPPQMPTAPVKSPGGFHQAILDRVQELLAGTGILVEAVEHAQYQDACFFRRGEDQTRINISYNGRGRITRVIALRGDDLAGDLVAILSVLMGEDGMSARPTPSPTVAPGSIFQAPRFSRPFLEEFHHRLVHQVQGHGIEVTGLDQKQWFQRYRFQGGTERTEVDIYYNGKQVFTKCQPVGHVPEPSALLRTVLEILTVGMNA